MRGDRRDIGQLPGLASQRGPEQYISQQPRLPHAQRRPSGTTVVWPYSEAGP